MNIKKLSYALWLVPSLGLAAESDAVLELLKALRAKGTIDEQTYQKVEQALKQESPREKTKTVAQETPVIHTKGKFEVASPDGDFKWRLRGRLHVNGGFFRNDDGALKRTPLEDGVDIRRARLTLESTIWKAWDFKIQYDFATTGGGDEGLRDVYLRYRFQDLPNAWPLAVTVGQFKEPLGLESLMSSNDMTFIERALGTRVFHDFGGGSDGRRVGVGLHTYGHELWTASAAVFGKAAAGNEFGKDQESDPLVFAGRVTLAPIQAEDRVVHLGFGGSWLKFDGPTAVRFRMVPEARMGESVRLIDTGFLPDTRTVVRLMPEAAVLYGPVSLQGEYLRAQLFGQDDHDFDSWYVQAAWTITGEPREYDFEDGIFKNPHPHSMVGQGGIGAWEVAARYSMLDLGDCANPLCAKEKNFTADLNWYVNPNAKLMFNYVRVLDLNQGAFEGANPDIFEASARLYF